MRKWHIFRYILRANKFMYDSILSDGSEILPVGLSTKFAFKLINSLLFHFFLKLKISSSVKSSLSNLPSSAAVYFNSKLILSIFRDAGINRSLRKLYSSIK